MKALDLPGWSPEFAHVSPLFESLRHLAKAFEHHAEWPGVAEYQAYLDAWPEPIMTLGGKPLKIVDQAGRPEAFEQHYAPRIYLSGEIQTRLENWHDFFQYLSWFMFPKTKAIINAIHLPYARERIDGGGELGRRSPMENMLSLFDEGGAVLVSSDEALLQDVRDFSWKSLFWHQRERLLEAFDCVPFGHAVYEKGLAPYLGMTANCILLLADAHYFALGRVERLRWIDEQLGSILEAEKQYKKPRDLQPFPILGMPGWDVANAEEAYYDNTAYFRPGRMRDRVKN